MLTHRPPNLITASGYLIGGLCIAACFLTTCFPSSAADIRSSISGNEWGVLVAFVLVGLLAVSVMSNVFRVVAQLFSQVIQLGVLGVAVWGGILLYQRHSQSEAVSPSASHDVEAQPVTASESQQQDAPSGYRNEATPNSGKWWQDNPYEKD